MSKRKATPQQKAGKKPARRRPGTGTKQVELPEGDTLPAPTLALVPAAPKLPTDDEMFLVLYVANGFNACQAWMSVHPNASAAAARVSACRKLTTANVKARLAELLEDRWKGIHMTGDEVLARVAMDARSDPRQLFDEKGKLLDPHDWPDDIANSIESVKVKPEGVEIKLASKTAARRTILEITGKVKGAAGTIDELADAMRLTIEKNLAALAAAKA